MRLKLHDQPFQILALLLERPGEIVTREEIREKLWPGNTFVDFDNGLNVAVKKLRNALNDDADNPRFVETIPRRGYRFLAPVQIASSTIATVVAPQQAAGASPGIAADVETISANATTSPVPVRRGQRGLIAVLVILLMAAGGLAVHRWRAVITPRAQAKSDGPKISLRRSVAVLGFRNASAQPDSVWLSTALSEMLSTELASGDKLRLISGEDVAQLGLGSSAAGSDSLSRDKAQHLHEVLATEFLVSGSYIVLGGKAGRQLRLDVRLQDAATGEILTEVAENGVEDNLFRLASRVGERLRQRLGLPKMSEQEAQEVLASAAANPEAERLYALGLSKLREFDALTARDLLQQAVAADPRYALAHSALSNAWADLGYDARAGAEAKLAYDLSGPLLPFEKMLVEALYRERNADNTRALTIYRGLFALFPDNVDYGLALVDSEKRTGQTASALETIVSLRRLPTPASEDPRIDVADALLARAGDKAAEILQRVEAKTKDSGPRLVYAQAKLTECLTDDWGAHPQETVATCEEARRIYLAAGDRRHAAIGERVVADRLTEEGNLPESLRHYREALAVFRQIGDRRNTATVLVNMGRVLETQGNLTQAGRMFREAFREFREVGDAVNVGTALGNIADVRLKGGDLRGALQACKEELKLARASRDEGRIVAALNDVATMQRMSGDLRDARQLAEESIRLIRKGGPGFNLALTLSTLGDVLLAEGDLPGAQSSYEEALSLHKRMKDVSSVAGVQQNLADLNLEEGNPAQAETLLRQAISEFESEKAYPTIAQAKISLGRALQMQGKLTEAKEALADVAQKLRSSRDPQLTMQLALVQARQLVAQAESSPGKSAQMRLARAQLQQVITRSQGMGFYSMESQARLALGEVEIETDPALGRSTLARLQQSASSHGFQLVARQAAALHVPHAIAVQALAQSGSH